MRWLGMLVWMWAAPAWAGELVQLDLDEALARFNDDSPTAEQLAARVDEARALVRLATAPALPVLVAQGSYTRNNAEVSVGLGDAFSVLGDSLPFELEIDTSGLPDDILIQPLNQLSTAASLQIPLLAPAAWAEIGAVRGQRDVVIANTEAAMSQARTALVRAAWFSRAAEELHETRERAVETTAEHLARAERRRDAGVGTALEVLAAETELSRRRSTLAQAEADLSKSRRALGALLGLGGQVRIDVGEVPEDARNAEASVRSASTSHPDLAPARAVGAATERAGKAVWWRHAPTLSASGQVFASDVPFPTGLKSGWRVGLQLQWVLYDGGARYGMLGRSQAQRAGAQASARQVELDADREVRDALEAVAVARVRLQLAEAGLRTATAAEASSARLFDSGLVTHLDALDAQQRLAEADAGRAGAVALVGAALADLDRVTGSL